MTHPLLRRYIVLAFALLLVQWGYANMASPHRRGSISSVPFSSRDIDILREKIHLTIGKDYEQATYRIEYLIQSQTSGNQIPLLFHAPDFESNFKIWVDGTEVKLLDIPSEYKNPANTPFEKFGDSFTASGAGDATTTIYWEENDGTVYRLNDLKYFEINLSKGEHKVHVEYTATAWKDIADWVTEYSFRYSLSPARHWKSFGSLEITVDAQAVGSTLTSNLGPPTTGTLDKTATWQLTQLPDDLNYWTVTYTPAISTTAQTLITVGPLGLTLVLALLVALLHGWAVWAYRKANPTQRFSWVVIVGSLLVPFLILVGYILSYDLIDSAIGEAAGRYHGYTFLVLVLYPFVLIVYWLIFWLMDRRYKRKLVQGSISQK